MKIIYKLIIVYFSSVSFNVHAFGTCDYYSKTDLVILGADCDANIQSGAPMSSDPLESDFVKMVETGECTGIVHDDKPMPECVASEIMSVDPTGSYFIYQNLGNGNLGPRGGGVILDTITLSEPGNNPFSIPWNWFKKLIGTADYEVYEQVYDVDDLPVCKANDLINNYNKYSETD